jgi:DNA (cytosine-5)-methyltransferase 1
MRNGAQKSVVSLFSGAMGLDIGLEQAGIATSVCVEILPKCCATIRLNRPEITVFEDDIRDLSTAEILAGGKEEAGKLFAVVGGPPCQSFSTGGKRGSIADPRGELFMEFIRVVREAKPKFFVFENVAQLMTAAVKHRPIADRPGKNWNLAAYSKPKNETPSLFREEADPMEDDELSGSAFGVILAEFEKLPYELTFGVLNAADYGVPQRRMRLVVVGSSVPGVYRLPEPTHAREPNGDGRVQWNGLREALTGLSEDKPLHSNYSEEFQRFFRMVPPGGNWRDMPLDEQRKALGNAFESGGGKTGFFRRLSWDEATPTIVAKPNRKSCAICHPDHLRPLTVRESARLQGFPDDWTFTGSMHDQYLQIGNAVPVGLGKVIGESLLKAAELAARRNGGNRSAESHQEWVIRRDAMSKAAKKVLQHAARNNVKKGDKAKARAKTELF